MAPPSSDEFEQQHPPENHVPSHGSHLNGPAHTAKPMLIARNEQNVCVSTRHSSRQLSL